MWYAATMPRLDPGIVDAAHAIVEAEGVSGLTIERVAVQAGLSRMTLHRRGVSRQLLVDALSSRAAELFLRALWPAMSADSSAIDRIEMSFDAICDTADQHLGLLAGLFADRTSPFHASGSEDIETLDVFVRPLARLLRDGAIDGTIEGSLDPDETAAVLFNVVGWGYIHLRHAQRWPAERARPAVVNLALRSLRAEGS
jgi:AcrR family transcriptional regulator